jgi:hypothetical protein
MDGYSKDAKRDMRIDMLEWCAFFKWAETQDGGYEPWLQQAEGYVAGNLGGQAAAVAHEKSKEAKLDDEDDDDLGGGNGSATDDVGERARKIFDEVDVDDSGVLDYTEMLHMFGEDMSSKYIGWMDGFHKNRVEKAKITWDVWVAFFEWTAESEDGGHEKWLAQGEAYLGTHRLKRFEATLNAVFRAYGGARFAMKGGRDDLISPILERTANSSAAHQVVFEKLSKQFGADLTPILNANYNLRQMNDAKKEEANAAAKLDPNSYMGRVLGAFREIDADASGDLKFMELLQIFTPKQANDYRSWTDGQNGEGFAGDGKNVKDNIITWAEWSGFFRWAEKQEGGGLPWLEQVESHVEARGAGRMARASRAAAIAHDGGATGAVAAASDAQRRAAEEHGFPPLPADVQARVMAVFDAIDTNETNVLEARELAKVFDPAQAKKYLSYMDGYVDDASQKSGPDGCISRKEWAAFFAWADSSKTCGIGCESWLRQAEGYVERQAAAAGRISTVARPKDSIHSHLVKNVKREEKELHTIKISNEKRNPNELMPEAVTAADVYHNLKSSAAASIEKAKQIAAAGRTMATTVTNDLAKVKAEVANDVNHALREDLKVVNQLLEGQGLPKVVGDVPKSELRGKQDSKITAKPKARAVSSTPFAIGMDVEAEWAGDWLPASIISVLNDQITVAWTSDGSQSDLPPTSVRKIAHLVDDL